MRSQHVICNRTARCLMSLQAKALEACTVLGIMIAVALVWGLA